MRRPLAPSAAWVMAVTEPDNPPYQKMSMILVPTDTPGVNIVRDVGLGDEPMGEIGGVAVVDRDPVAGGGEGTRGGAADAA